VCSSVNEKSVFRQVAARIPEEPEKKNVLHLFEILTGEKPLSEGEQIIPDFKVPAGTSNDSWRTLKSWSRWWKRINHLSEYYFLITALFQTCTITNNCIH